MSQEPFANFPEVGAIGMIGLGNMGFPMAGRLLDAGCRLSVYDVDPVPLKSLSARGAIVASSPVELGNRVDTVLVCLPNPAIVYQVALGENGLFQADRFSKYVDLSTTGLEMSLQVAARLASKGVAVLDCPISGGVVGAENGTLALMAAGEETLFRALKPVLDVFGSHVCLVGHAPGQGQIMKLINNLISVTAWTVTAEGLSMGVKHGLDPEMMLDVLNAGTAKNIITQDRFRRHILSGRYDSGFSMEGIYKDISLCMEAGKSMESAMPIGEALHGVWGHAVENGWGKKAHAHIASLYEEWNAITFASRGDGSQDDSPSQP